MNKISLENPKKYFPKKPASFPTFRQCLYLPALLNSREKRIAGFLLALSLISGITLAAKLYVTFTVPVPGVGGTYREGLLKEPRFINPVFIANDTDRDIVQLIFSSLINYNSDGVQENDLADRYEISNDGKTYTFFLKKNVFWHDGKPLTADDVVFTIQTIQNPLYKSPLRANWQGVTAEKIDDYSVRFSLKQPYSPFLENLTVGILPKHLWEAIEPQNAPLNELNLKPIGSGPYKFYSFDQKSDGTITRYELTRNSRYYGEGPFIKNIKLMFYKSEEEMIAAFKAGKIDGLSSVSAKNTSIFKNEKAAVYAINIPRIFAIFLNRNSSPILADKNIRLALNYSIDKKKIVNDILSGGAVVAESPIPPGLNVYSDVGTPYEFSPEKAKKILDDAGWKNNDENGLREKTEQKKGKSVKTQLKINLVTSDWPDLIKMAEAIKSMWAEIGADTSIKIVSIGQLENSVIQPRNYEALLFGEIFTHSADPFAFWHSSQQKDPGLNIALYSNKRADQLLEEARRTDNANIAKEKYDEFQKLVINDAAAVFLNSPLYFYVVSSEVKGIKLKNISLPSDRFNEINKWFIKTKRVLR